MAKRLTDEEVQELRRSAILDGLFAVAEALRELFELRHVVATLSDPASDTDSEKYNEAIRIAASYVTDAGQKVEGGG